MGRFGQALEASGRSCLRMRFGFSQAAADGPSTVEETIECYITLPAAGVVSP